LGLKVKWAVSAKLLKSSAILYGNLGNLPDLIGKAIAHYENNSP
jgi:hypothetical protein